MDAFLTDEQRALQQMAADLFASVNPPTRVRDLYDGAVRDRKVWKQLAEVGLTSLGVPDDAGGSGGGAVEVGLVLEEAGRACLPEPLGDTVAVAVPALLQHGGASADEWLPRIAAGDALVSVHWSDDPFVTEADDADAVLHEDGDALYLVPRDGVEVVRQVRTEDGSRRRFEARIDVGAGERLSVDVGDLANRTVVAIAAQLVGVSQRLLDDTVAYAKVRHQFDTPIGAFQATQHKLASMFVTVESARGAVRTANRMLADHVDTGEAEHAARVAKAAAGTASRLVNTEALQIHAGIGFTWEHDLHLWLKRGLALEHAGGDAALHHRVLGRRLLEGAP
jgi:alkylation response protein AidB-like acyl-CoA dehydrogenase